MNETLFLSIASAGFTIAFLHAAIPTHWLPFVLIARGQGWSTTKTLSVTALAGFAILQTGWLWLDPAISLVIVGIIVWSTLGLLKDSLAMSPGAVPAAIDPGTVRRYFESLPGVTRIHDLHIWPIGTNEVALTCHLVMPRGHPGDSFLEKTAAELASPGDSASVTRRCRSRSARSTPARWLQKRHSSSERIATI